MNDSAGMNTTPFNLSDIWSIPINSSAGEIRSGPFGPDFGRFMESGPDPEVSGSGDVDMEQSTVTGGFARKRREDDANAPEDDVCIDSMSDSDAKRLKTSGFGDDNKNSEVDGEASSGKEEQKPKTLPEPFKDYIHVRARRGQATDSHSLAERARREKISDRMRVLQDLVPNCNKVIGKAPVLDEIINYVQSLQRQVEFLSMKLETVNTRITPGLEGFPAKDFGQQAYGTPGMVYGSQSCEPSTEYGRSSSPEWLHMQLGGGGFGRQT